MRRLVSLLTGLVFGLGLLVSDMVNPARVLAFLDLFGAWDPTLIFVMGGAMVLSFVGWRVASGRRVAFLGGAMPGTAPGEIDRNLVAGSVVFGIGWGLVGICPGPAVVALASGGGVAFFIFFGAMLAGMVAWNLVLAQRLIRLPG
jgi:uncharacterized protein